jgi:hypothetical protein
MLTRLFHPKAAQGWSRIPPSEIPAWNEKLLHTAASYHQYPFWIEPYRHMGIKRRYLRYVRGGVPIAYVCVQSIGLPRVRLGVIVNGPVGLEVDLPVDEESLRDLVVWARRAGYVFLKFSHFDPELLRCVGSLPRARTVDAFPFFGSQDERLVVPLQDNEDAMLAAFQPVARYEIRAAVRAGYDIRVSDSPDDFASIWPMIERLSERKGFHVYRPVAGWQDMIARASEHRCARVYTAALESKIVQAILVVRDARTAEYRLGALDVNVLGKRPSPACLLHWHAMRDMHRLGCLAYNLGPPSGPVFQFKRKFRPASILPPPSVSVVTSRGLYWCWSNVLLRAAAVMWPAFRSTLARILRRK